MYYINANEIPNHFTLIVFGCERGDLLCSHNKGQILTCEDNMLFSHVEISSFRTKAHMVFHLVFQILKKIKLEKTAFIAGDFRSPRQDGER